MSQKKRAFEEYSREKGFDWKIRRTLDRAGPNEASPDHQGKTSIATIFGIYLQSAWNQVKGKRHCLIVDLPTEILLKIVGEVATADLADFLRLSLVCKRFASIFATDEAIWRRVCLESDNGFGAMSYNWQEDGRGRVQQLPNHWQGSPGWVEPEIAMESERRRAIENEARSFTLWKTLYGSSWRRMFQERLRVRFNGYYFNASTYFNWYLRFFRGGTMLRCFDTGQRNDIAQYLTKEKQHTISGFHINHPDMPVIWASRGRWRFSDVESGSCQNTQAENYLSVQTLDARGVPENEVLELLSRKGTAFSPAPRSAAEFLAAYHALINGDRADSTVG